MEERRRAQRFRVLKGGYLIFNNGRSTINCVVRNLSETGAKISVADIVGIPHEFKLALPGSGTRACRMVWHTATELGVAFVDEAGAGAGAMPQIDVVAVKAG